MRAATIRLLLVALGLVAAWCGGFAVAAFAVSRDLARLAEMHDLLPGEMLFFGFPVMVLTGPGFLAAGLAVALIGEAFSIRSWMFYVASGAVVSLVGCRVFALAGDGALLGDEAALGAGLAAGLCYWLVAGRSAGFSAA